MADRNFTRARIKLNSVQLGPIEIRVQALSERSQHQQQALRSEPLKDWPPPRV